MQKNILTKVFLVTLFIGLLFPSCSSSENDSYKLKTENPEFIHRSIKKVTDVMVNDILSPPVASRIYAYISIGAYETARHGNPNLVSLVGQLHGLENIPQPDEKESYSYSVAAVHAILKIGKHLIFSENQIEDFHQSILKELVDTGIPEEEYSRSIAFGEAVANAVIAWSNEDNYKQTRSMPKYTVSDDANTWKPTPPAYMEAIEPHWNKIRTFVIDSAQQFRPIPMTSFSIEKDSKFYQEALETYEVGNNLTDEQRAIAFFWDCNPFVMNVRGHAMFATKKISPGGHWVNITHVACVSTKMDYALTTEAYARVSIALADAFISCWDEKYRSNVIRPETYINEHIDKDWLPTLQTPPFPEYTSGHSVISSAAAVVLTDIFGDHFAFTDSTEVEFGLKPRSFTSFMEASREAAISRLYGGIHYRPACMVGIDEGQAIGRFVVSNVQTRKEALAQKD